MRTEKDDRAALAQPSPAPEQVQRFKLDNERYIVSDEEGDLVEYVQHHRIAGALLAEIKDADGLAKMLGDLLREIDLTIHGPEPELTRSGYPDLPQRVKTLVEERNAAQVRGAELEKHEPLPRQFVNAVKQLCKDFSDLQNRPYMGDVYAALDGLLEYEQIPVAQAGQVPDGFALVPIEPTVAMRMPWKTMRGYSWHSKYKAMLAAASVQRGEL